MQTRTTLIRCLTLCLLLSPLALVGFCDIYAAPPPPTVTILCYMNGDNDLSNEVLHALDMMETVGSSDRVNVVVLVDGQPEWLGPYDAAWSRTRLLHLQADPRIGRITSPVLEEWGEANMGSPQTLERFLRTALAAFLRSRFTSTCSPTARVFSIPVIMDPCSRSRPSPCPGTTPAAKRCLSTTFTGH
jgi:hypothetical protein